MAGESTAQRLLLGALVTIAAAGTVVAAGVWGSAMDPLPIEPPVVEAEEEPEEEASLAEVDYQALVMGLPAPQEVTFTVIAGGDLLMHEPLSRSAWNGTEYDFVPLMEPVKPFLEGADLAICHFEVPVGAPGDPPVGFPIFSAPYELAANVAEVGWDGCSTASNHAADQGWEGLVRTLDALDEVGLGHSGTARTEAEANQPQLYLLEKDGRSLTVAHIALANSLNGLPLRDDAPWATNIHDVDRALREAAQARNDGADLVIVSYHCCGVEYDSTVEPRQEANAQVIADSGLVDILIQHHAHVPKTMTVLPGGPTGEGMWVAYGTGNFISDMGTWCCPEVSTAGLLVSFDVVLDPEGNVSVDEGWWTAITVERESDYRVVQLTEEGADVLVGTPEHMRYRYGLVADIMAGSPAKERVEPVNSPGKTTVIERSS